MSRATLARLREPAVWTSYPGSLALASMAPQGRPAVPGDWGLGPKALGVDQLSRATRARIRGPAGQPDIPGDSGADPRACRIAQDSWSDQLSRATRAWVRWPAGTSSSRGRVALVRLPAGLNSSPG